MTSTYEIGGIYFVWSSAPSKWELFAYESNGSLTSVLEGGTERYLTQYVYVPSEYAEYRNFRLVMTPDTTSSAIDLASLSIFGPGNAPYYAPAWQPFTGRTDLLTIVSHPDDEDLYMSVPEVTYANQGMKCETVFMTYGSNSTSVRRYEAQESVWSLGNKSYPVMGNFVDVKTTTKEGMMSYWPLESTISFIVEQIRKYKPSVVVTHDVRGEYGHGAHMLTEYATELAFQYAADPDIYPDSAAKYGTWTAGKLYVHLYSTNALNTMSLTANLSAFENKTVLKVIQDAYSRQKSQLPGRSLPTSGSYDMRKFGLVASNLGADWTHDSMFENVSNEAMLALDPWYNYEIVDRTALKQALDSASVKIELNYTPESWEAANFLPLIAPAQNVMDTRESTQAQVDQQVKLLNDAMNKLEAYLSSLQVTNPADRLYYMVGECLDLRGLVVKAVYSDGIQKVIPIDADNISGFNSSAPTTQQEVSITYADKYSTKNASFYVDIIPSDGEKIESAIYTLNRLNWLLTDVSVGTSAQRLIANLENDAANLKVYDKSGNEYSGDTVITGMTVKLTIDGIITDELRLSVLGDVSGDGIIDINDVLYIRAHILDTYTLKAYQSPTADINKDMTININDILYIRAHILGTYNIHAKEE